MIRKEYRWSEMQVYPVELAYPSPPLSEKTEQSLKSIIYAINQLNTVLSIDTVISHTNQLTLLDVLQNEYKKSFEQKKVSALKVLFEKIILAKDEKETTKIYLEAEIGVNRSIDAEKVKQHLRRAALSNRGLEPTFSIKHIDFYNPQNTHQGFSFYILFTCIVSE